LKSHSASFLDIDTIIDSEFTENTEAIIAQFRFKDLKVFIKNQALLMLLAKIEKFEAENRILWFMCFLCLLWLL